MGVDDLTVDEMHEFKNPVCDLGERVVGMNDPNGSKKAFDLYAKVRRHPAPAGGSVTGATGTPVSNSLVELSTPSCRISRTTTWPRRAWPISMLVRRLCRHGDQARIYRDAEAGSRGALASLTNLASLHQLYSAFADTITMATIKARYAEDVAARNKALGTHERTGSSRSQRSGTARTGCCAMGRSPRSSPSSWTISSPG